jgi:CubicO group peptidase (beta-lactamase class C family)
MKHFGCMAQSRAYLSAIAVMIAVATYPAWPDSWLTAEPDSLDIDLEAVADFQELCEQSGADACLVAHQGQIVMEWYAPAYAEPIYTMSSVKSWTALLVGMVVSDGRIKDIDEPVANYLPEWSAGAEAGVTVRQLLTMTAGLATRNQRAGPKQSIGFVENKNAFVLGLPLDFEPGTKWAYSNEGVQLLSPLLEKVTDMHLDEYARGRLFEPLDMTDTSLHVYPRDQVWTYGDAETTLRDFSRIGQLILGNGMYRGRQLIDNKWIQQCISPVEKNRKYGMLWWLHYRAERNPARWFLAKRFPRLLQGNSKQYAPFAVATQGYLCTDCYVIPEDRLVASRMQMKPAPPGYIEYGRMEALQILDRIVED